LVYETDSKSSTLFGGSRGYIMYETLIKAQVQLIDDLTNQIKTSNDAFDLGYIQGQLAAIASILSIMELKTTEYKNEDF